MSASLQERMNNPGQDHSEELKTPELDGEPGTVTSLTMDRAIIQYDNFEDAQAAMWWFNKAFGWPNKKAEIERLGQGDILRITYTNPHSLADVLKHGSQEGLVEPIKMEATEGEPTIP